MNESDVLIAIFGAIVGVLLQTLITAVPLLSQLRGKEFSGKRWLILPSSGGKGERIDAYRIRQSGQRLQATIKRLSPMDEKRRRWRMVGYSHGNTLVGVFYPTSTRKDSSSYGVLVLHRDPQIKDYGVWRGYYVRPDLYGLEAILKADIARHPAVLQDVDPIVKNFGEDVTPGPLPKVTPPDETRQTVTPPDETRQTVTPPDETRQTVTPP